MRRGLVELPKLRLGPVLVTSFVVFGVDTGENAWWDVVASLVCVRPPQKRDSAQREETKTDADGQI
jgi:hypothetical protein